MAAEVVSFGLVFSRSPAHHFDRLALVARLGSLTQHRLHRRLAPVLLEQRRHFIELAFLRRLRFFDQQHELSVSCPMESVSDSEPRIRDRGVLRVAVAPARELRDWLGYL